MGLGGKTVDILMQIVDTFWKLLSYGVIILFWIAVVCAILLGIYMLYRFVAINIEEHCGGAWTRHCKDVETYLETAKKYKEIRKGLKRLSKGYNKKGTLKDEQYEELESYFSDLMHTDFAVLNLIAEYPTEYFTDPKTDDDYEMKLKCLMNLASSLPKITCKVDNYYAIGDYSREVNIPASCADIFKPETYGADNWAKHPDSCYTTFEDIEKRCELRKTIVLWVFRIFYILLVASIFIVVIQKIYDYSYYRMMLKLLEESTGPASELLCLGFLWR
jgi:hypothetical protein